VVVANLETAKLRGLESQGMLLAASDEGRVVLLTPEKTVEVGSKVS
jgi:methionyl-tRNA synthetase